MCRPTRSARHTHLATHPLVLLLHSGPSGHFLAIRPSAYLAGAFIFIFPFLLPIAKQRRACRISRHMHQHAHRNGLSLSVIGSRCARSWDNKGARLGLQCRVLAEFSCPIGWCWRCASREPPPRLDLGPCSLGVCRRRNCGRTVRLGSASNFPSLTPISINLFESFAEPLLTTR